MNKILILSALPGDIFDNEYDAVHEPKRSKNPAYQDQLLTVFTPVGGNHDLNEPILAGFTFNHKKEESEQPQRSTHEGFSKNSNIQLLEDEAVLIDNSFYVVGRKDASLIEKIEEKRKTLPSLPKAGQG